MKIFVVLFAGLALTAAYQTGAPEGACGDLTPQHGKDPQTSPSPYVIAISSSSIKPRGKVFVTLSAKPGDSFKGFFIQARVGGEPVGKFETADGVKLVSCGNGVNNAVTHTNADPKEKVVVAWIAPPSLSENVIFTVTTARDGYTYWVAQKSSILSVQA